MACACLQGWCLKSILNCHHPQPTFYIWPFLSAKDDKKNPRFSEVGSRTYLSRQNLKMSCNCFLVWAWRFKYDINVQWSSIIIL